MPSRKIIHFQTEKYERTGEFISKKCQECNLNISERLDRCFNGCYDKIIKSDEYIKAGVDIFNSVECQIIMSKTIEKLDKLINNSK